MKRPSNWGWQVMVFVVFWVWGLPTEAMQEEGILEQVRGEVRIFSAEGVMRLGQAGMVVGAGEIVESKAQSSARILLWDESVIELKADSRIELNDSRANPGAVSSVLLYFGRLWAEMAGSQEGDTVFEVVTATAVAGVRGTAFSAAVGIDGATRVGVERGEMVIEGEGGSVKLRAEEETVVELGLAPGPVLPYRGGEEEWERWAAARREALVGRAEVFAAVAARNARLAQIHLVGQQRELERLQRRWEAYERRQLRRGREAALTPAFRREAGRQFREMFRLARQLQRTDNRMMAGYFLLQRLEAEMQAHPEQYRPEEQTRVQELRQELEGLALSRRHQENLVLLDRYTARLEDTAIRLNLNPELRRRLTSRQRQERLQELRDQRGRPRLQPVQP